MRSEEIQTAIFGVLSGNAPLVASLSQSWTDDLGAVPAIFSATPQENFDDDDFYPFISFGEDTTAPFDTKDTNGGEDVVQIDVWTRTDGYVEAKAIASAVYDLVQKQALIVANANHLTTNMDSVSFSPDPDRSTRRGLMLFTVLYQDE